MKILKHKNLMGLIFSALLAMPLLGIVARCGYVIANKNAYQSYYGETINEKQQVDLENTSQLKLDNDYIFTLKTGLFDEPLPNNVTIEYDFIEILNINSITASSIENSYKLVISSTQVDAKYRYNYSFYWDNTSGSQQSTWDIALTFRFNLTGYGSNVGKMITNDMLSQYEYNKYSYLDNVFEYSISTFTSENNLGNVNLFSWFTDIFLSDNAHNNLYVGFANWYMNYAMLIACMHLLFLVLMWFVNFARRLLERGMNYDF